MENIGVALGTHNGQDTYVTWLALAGRYHEAIALGEPLRPAGTAARGDDDGADLWHGLGIAYAALGRPDAAQQAFARAREFYHQTDYPFQAGWLAVHELVWVTIPYGADEPAARRRLAAEAEVAWSRAGGLFTALPPRLASLPALLLDGDWPEILQQAGGAARSAGPRPGGSLPRMSARRWPRHKAVPRKPGRSCRKSCRTDPTQRLAIAGLAMARRSSA